MSTSGPSGDDDEDSAGTAMSDINVTPFVDVMLVLLIIFMVAAPMMMVGVPVQLPRTAAARVSQTAPPVVVSVNREGQVFLRSEPVAEADLTDRIRAMREAEANDGPVYVRGDRSVPYGDVMRVMGKVTAAGVARVSLIAEAEPAGPAVQAR
ncbi:protein TolR [Roseococcus sp. SYP-B2431]|nr:protein TolR [Roseococcus sp. SYP-B2431]TCI00534.1 protein TolR [Roseococcus sp. SYP-B2431]